MSLRKQVLLSLFVTLSLLTLSNGCKHEEPSKKDNGSTAPMAKIIENNNELIGGPNALAVIGDCLLQNDKIRVIVQKPGYSRGSNFYGGSIIDADLIRPDGIGRDNFGEMMPIFFLMGMEPETMEIIDNGQSSHKAHLRVTGRPGPVVTLITKFYPLFMGDLYQEQVAFQIDYFLEMGKPYVEIHTSLVNTQDYALEISLKALTDLAKTLLHLNINLDIPMPAGDVLLFGAGNSVFIPGIAGYDLQYTLENKLYFEQLALPSLPGLAADFMATSGPEVSYGIFNAPHERNFVNMTKDYYANATDHSLEIPFLMDGLTGAFHTWMPELLEPHGVFTTIKYFAVGDGDVGSIREIYQDFYQQESAAFNGQVLEEGSDEPLANISVVVYDHDKEAFSQYFTDQNGHFDGRLPPGTYYMRAVSEERFSTPMEEAVEITVTKDGKAQETIYLGQTAKLAAIINDDKGNELPAKVVLVGKIDDAHGDIHPMEFLYDYSINEKMRPNDLSWTIKDGYGQHEYIEKLFNTANGHIEENVRPGKYTVVISRGPEYNQYRQDIELKAGELTSIEATLKRVIDTGDYAGGDVHIHSVASLDSFTLLPDRVTSLVAEGMDFAIATDHNSITNYEPDTKKLGLSDMVKPIVGMEYTSFEMGHFNGYPLRYDANTAVHGISPWVPAPAADASEEEWAQYDALPSYLRKPNRPDTFGDPSGFEWMILNPQELMDELRHMGKYSPEETIVVVNHPRDTFMGYFNAFNLDTNTGMPRPDPKGLTGMLMSRTYDIYGMKELNNGNFKCDNFSFDFDAIEVLNGGRLDLLHSAKMPLDATTEEIAALNLPEGNGPGKVLINEDGQHAFPGGVNDWFNLLNQGYRYAVVGSSDSHRILEDQVGINRTYLQVGNKLASSLDEREMVKAIKGRHTIATNGPFITLALENSTGETATIGQDLTAANGQVKVKISLKSTHWIKVDRLVLWINGEEARIWTKDDGLPGTLADDRYSFDTEEVISLTKDSWLVLEAYGDDEGRNSLWPIYISRQSGGTNIANVANDLIDSLGFSMGGWGRFKPQVLQRAYPYAITSPIWVDADGQEGFTSPAAKATKCEAWK